jgi:pyruvate dehydrogenase E1 component alpha subunit
MHVADFSRGILGANGIVGGGIALAAGAALSAQLKEQREVAVAFFGDGAASQGVLGEALNLAALWRLPLILVCENNSYSEFSPTQDVTAGAIVDRAKPFGVPGVVVDGNSLLDVWRAASEAIARARGGLGPTLIEARTYRFHGHVEGETAFLRDTYREENEVEVRRREDPVVRWRMHLLGERAAPEAAVIALEAEIGAQVEDAADQAAQDPWPELSSLERLQLSPP